MCTLGLSHFMRGKGISNKAVGRSVDLGEARKIRRSFSRTDFASISAKIWGGQLPPKHSQFRRPCQIANSSLKALIACSPFRPLFLEKTFSHVADRDAGIGKPCKHQAYHILHSCKHIHCGNRARCSGLPVHN